MYLLGIAPGIIYSVWRRKGIKQVCAACGSDQLVAAKTRAGRQIIAGQFDVFTVTADIGSSGFKQPTFGKLTAIICGFFSVSMMMGALVGMIYSNKEFAALGLINVGIAFWLGWSAFRFWNKKPVAVKIGQGLVGR